MLEFGDIKTLKKRLLIWKVVVEPASADFQWLNYIITAGCVYVCPSLYHTSETDSLNSWILIKFSSRTIGSSN